VQEHSQRAWVRSKAGQIVVNSMFIGAVTSLTQVLACDRDFEGGVVVVLPWLRCDDDGEYRAFLMYALGVALAWLGVLVATMMVPLVHLFTMTRALGRFVVDISRLDSRSEENSGNCVVKVDVAALAKLRNQNLEDGRVPILQERHADESTHAREALLQASVIELSVRLRCAVQQVHALDDDEEEKLISVVTRGHTRRVCCTMPADCDPQQVLEHLDTDFWRNVDTARAVALRCLMLQWQLQRSEGALRGIYILRKYHVAFLPFELLKKISFVALACAKFG